MEVRIGIGLCLLLQTATLSAGGNFVGSQACAGCHSEQHRKHVASMHERALRPASASHARALFDRPIRERNGIEFTYSATPGGLLVEARKGDEAASATLDWIFGAGTLAFTPVGQDNGAYIEHRISWYSASQRPGMTLGHPPSPPSSPRKALGERQSPETIYRCFNCHATAVKPGPDLSSMHPGVQCERCHGPGGDHVQAPARTNVRGLTKLSPEASIRVCAECHRSPADGSGSPEIHDPMSIRFAPVGLMASKCFQQSESLTCSTCHDPHSAAKPAALFVQEKCRGCHAAASASKSDCPRQLNPDSNCLSCHMKKATPVPDLTFTDHRIRVYPAALRN